MAPLFNPRRFLATFLILLLVAPGVPAAGPSAQSSLSEEQKILHALNRLGFGPRPGDVARVREMGLEAWIEQQLNPESIPNDALEQRLASFETLKMSTMELITRYPPPQLIRPLARQLAIRAGMDPESGAREIAEELGLGRPQNRARREGNQRPGAEPGAQEFRRAQQQVLIELSQAKLVRAVSSERQLEEVMADFWFNHFNVFFGKGAARVLTTSYEQEAIRPHALGKFRDLLGATARHPAMLFYLDNWMSVDPKADVDPRELRRRYLESALEDGVRPGQLYADILRNHGLDPARYLGVDGEPRGFGRQRMPDDQMRFDQRRRGRFGARRMPPDAQRRPQQQQQRRLGLNENYARELLELHTLGVDGGYTQQDIIEVARCFTGWTMRPLQLGPKFIFLPDLHDRGAKSVLGQKIPAGGSIEDGERVLNTVARHPATARFISTKLARRFVSDNPPESLVKTMADTFTKTDGDIRGVLRTMFNAPEFWSPEAYRAKVKTPLEFVVSAARATRAELEDFPPGLMLALRELGQPLYFAQPPTGYKDTADAWVSTGGLLNRMKVALGVATNQLPGVRTPAPEVRAASPEKLVAELGERVLGEPLPERSRAALAAQLEKGLAVAGAPFGLAAGEPQGKQGMPDAAARLALGWVLASPEFQRR